MPHGDHSVCLERMTAVSRTFVEASVRGSGDPENVRVYRGKEWLLSVVEGQESYA